MIELVVVAPLVALIGLSVLQYALLFLAKNQINYAGDLAARAGSTGNARIGTIFTEYTKGLVPLYGGGTDAAGLAASLAKASADTALYAKVELLNPTVESFREWNDPKLQAKYGTGVLHVIPNANLAARDDSVKPGSGQSIQDANLLKLRIVHGYAANVPIAGKLFGALLKASDTHSDPFYSSLLEAGRIPVVATVTMHMQSDAIEGPTASSPGSGNNGTPSNPGNPADPTTPTDPGTSPGTDPAPTDPNTPCTGADCPVCAEG